MRNKHWKIEDKIKIGNIRGQYTYEIRKNKEDNICIYGVDRDYGDE